jgi:aspartate carbamoyltransferase catalytic subunit
MARVYSEALLSTSNSTTRDRLMDDRLFGKDIISIRELSIQQINQILDTAERLKAQKPLHLLDDKIIAHCFFEPSTRTRLSFETATLRLGGRVIGFSTGEATSIKKGESLKDTIRMISEYADLIVIRHPNEGSARLAAAMTDKPVVNAGDGANQHPTQSLVDLFTIRECQQQLDGLAVALVGDLKYGRAIHSFVQACMRFDIRLFLVSPNQLALPDSLCDALKNAGVRFSFHHSLEEVIPKVDIVYMSRVQHERFGTLAQGQVDKDYILTMATLEKARSNLKILHPLPRLNEIAEEVDQSPHAHYFQQAANGIYVRQAILSLLLNEDVR